MSNAIPTGRPRPKQAAELRSLAEAERLRVRKAKKRRAIQRASDDKTMRVRISPEGTKVAQGEFLNGFLDHANITQACEEAMIHRELYYSWMKNDEEFRRSYRLAKRLWIDRVEMNMIRRATEKDTLAGIFILKHNRKRYKEMMGGKDAAAVPSELTPGIRAQLLERLERLAARERPALQVGGVEVHEKPRLLKGKGSPNGQES